MNFLKLLVVGSFIPSLSWAGQQMECQLYDLRVDKDESQVEITLPQFNDSEKIFGSEGVTFGPHEQVHVIFNVNDCTELIGNLITCAGVPIKSIVTPYWTNNKVEVEMDRVSVQLREVQALSFLSGKKYETLQISLSGKNKDLKGGSALVDVSKKRCR